MPTIPTPSSKPLEGETPASVSKFRATVGTDGVGDSGQVASDEPHKLSDEAREAAIKHAGNLVVKFANEGKLVNAMHALTMMHALIAGRAPEWIAKREAQIQQAIAASPGGSGCYFMEAGERDRQAMNEREGGSVA